MMIMRKRCKVCNGLIEKRSYYNKKIKKMISGHYNMKTERLCNTCCDYAIYRCTRDALNSI